MESITPFLINIPTWFISSIALVFSYLALRNSIYASKLTKEKLRLDLYNKRFAIYTNILDYALPHQFSPKIDHVGKEIYSSEIKIEFIKAFSESKFLFESDSQVYKIIENIKDVCSKIACHYEYPDMKQKDIQNLQLSIAIELTRLEHALMPYLKFDLDLKQ